VKRDDENYKLLAGILSAEKRGTTETGQSATVSEKLTSSRSYSALNGNDTT